MLTKFSQLNPNATYSYADYLTWRFEEAVELIKGKIQLMCPAPTVKHQQLSRELLLKIGNYLHKQSCQIFHAPFDVKLYNINESTLADNEVYTVVQPDLCVICDPAKITERGCDGAPDWIIEILSPSTAKKDLSLKFELYAETGVKEYWLVYPYEQSISQFFLDEQTAKYQLVALYAADDIATPVLFPELNIALAEIF